MYDVDIYTINGTIIPNECHTIDEVLDIVRSSVDFSQVINIVNRKI